MKAILKFGFIDVTADEETPEEYNSSFANAFSNIYTAKYLKKIIFYLYPREGDRQSIFMIKYFECK